MTLKDENLFGLIDKVQTSIARIREFEAQAVKMHPGGYWVAFSGGKDSIVLLDLVKTAGVKYEAHFNLTTVDPPELLKYIRQHYPDVTWDRPKKSMFRLIAEKMMPPTRHARYCCRYLKEEGGVGRMVTTGIRWEESYKRSKRRLVEVCAKNKTKIYIHPIIDWTSEEIWQYIKENNLPYCHLYDEGFTRIGCVGCPMSPRGKRRDFTRWPRFERAYRRAFAAAVLARARQGTRHVGDVWVDGDAMFDWWMNEDRTKLEDSDQGVLFE